MRVDLVYSADCPNVDLARNELRRAFEAAKLEPTWNEVLIGSAEAPAHTRGYGSPTVLVNGEDVAGLAPSAEHCCRVYDGGARAPSGEEIVRALKVA